MSYSRSLDPRRTRVQDGNTGSNKTKSVRCVEGRGVCSTYQGPEPCTISKTDLTRQDTEVDI